MDSRPPAFNPNYPGPHQVPGYPAGTKPAYPNPYPNLPGLNQPIYPDGTPHPSVTHGSAPPPSYSTVSSANALPPGYPVATPGYPAVNPTVSAYGVPPQPMYQPYPPTQPYPSSQPYPPYTGTGIAPPAGFVNVMPQVPCCGPIPAPYPNLQSYTPGFVGFVFEPTPAELRAKKMIVQYNTSADTYVRPKDCSNTGSLAGWRSCVYQQQNMYRKEEHDWQKVYLARDVGTDFASIEWRFDLTRVGRRVACLKISFGTKTYKSGNVTVFAISDRGVRYDVPSNASAFKIKDADGWERFSIIAELRGGEGAEAWQNTQLFRQPKAIMMNNCPFHVSVRLR